MALALNEVTPFISNFAVGCGFAWVTNVPRMFQINKIMGISYPEYAKVITTKQGFTDYV